MKEIVIKGKKYNVLEDEEKLLLDCLFQSNIDSLKVVLIPSSLEERAREAEKNEGALLKSLNYLLSIDEDHLKKFIQDTGLNEQNKNGEILKLLKSRRQELIEISENSIFDAMIRKYLWTKPEEDRDHGIVKRPVHGGMHASRVALHSMRIADLLETKLGKKFTDKERFLMKIAGISHDLGRKQEGCKDRKEWELDGANKCKKLLELGGFTEEEINPVYEALIDKKEESKREKRKQGEQIGDNIYAVILDGADSVDWVRLPQSNFTIFPLNHKYSIALQRYITENELLDLARFAKEVVFNQGDCIRPQFEFNKNYDYVQKAEYENSGKCFAMTRMLFNKLLHKEQVQEISHEVIESSRYIEETPVEEVSGPVSEEALVETSGANLSEEVKEQIIKNSEKSNDQLPKTEEPKTEELITPILSVNIKVTSPGKSNDSELKKYTKITDKAGSNNGGFFKDSDGNECYIKFNDHKHAKLAARNEYLAYKLYELFGISVPKADTIEFLGDDGKTYYGIMTEKVELKSLYAAFDSKRDKQKEFEPHTDKQEAYDQFKAKVQEGFLIDCFLCNWDVIGGHDNTNLCVKDSNDPIRLDAGGALFFKARLENGLKLTGNDKGSFGEIPWEFETFFDSNLIYRYAPKVFDGVYESTSLLKSLSKLLSVTDEQIEECITKFGFDDKARNKELVRLLKARRLKLVEMAEEKIFNLIINQYLKTKPAQDEAYYQGIDSKLLENEADKANPILRAKHGGMHASRVVLYAEQIIAALKKKGYGPAINLTPKQQFFIKVAAMFHDSGREKDSAKDTQEWEQAGAEKCKAFLLKGGFTQEEIQPVCEALQNKKENHKTNIYALVLDSADSIDWVRSHSKPPQGVFKIEEMPEKIKQLIPNKELITLAKFAKQLANAQGDSPNAQLGQKGCFDINTKKKFEFSEKGCFSATKALANDLRLAEARKFMMFVVALGSVAVICLVYLLNRMNVTSNMFGSLSSTSSQAFGSKADSGIKIINPEVVKVPGAQVLPVGKAA